MGVGAPIEVIQAQAVAASFEEQLIDATSLDFHDRGQPAPLILDRDRPDYWDVKIEPTSTILLTERTVDLNDRHQTALANRPRRADHAPADASDGSQSEGEREPDASVARPHGGLTATGTAGTQFSYGSGFPPPILSQNARTSAARSAMRSWVSPSWTFGVVFGYPLGKSGPEAAVAQTQLQKRQQELSLQQLETDIVRQVREAAREVQTAYQLVHASEAAMQATQQQLDAAQRRFEVGLASSFEVQQNQRDLASARLNNLQAKISYNRALISLNAVQKIAQ